MSVSTFYYIYTLADGLQPIKKNQWFVLRSVTFILLDCLCLFTNTCVHYVRLSPLIYRYIFGLALITVTNVPLPYTHLKHCSATLKISITNQVIVLMYHDDVRYINKK